MIPLFSATLSHSYVFQRPATFTPAVPRIQVRTFYDDPIFVLIGLATVISLVSSASKAYHQRKIVALEMTNPSSKYPQLKFLIDSRDRRIEKLPSLFHEEVARLQQEREINNETINEIRAVLEGKI